MTKVQKGLEVYFETQDNVSATQREYAQAGMMQYTNMITQGHSTPVEFLHLHFLDRDSYIVIHSPQNSPHSSPN